MKHPHIQSTGGLKSGQIQLGMVCQKGNMAVLKWGVLVGESSDSTKWWSSDVFFWGCAQGGAHLKSLTTVSQEFPPTGGLLGLLYLYFSELNLVISCPCFSLLHFIACVSPGCSRSPLTDGSCCPRPAWLQQLVLSFQCFYHCWCPQPFLLPAVCWIQCYSLIWTVLGLNEFVQVWWPGYFSQIELLHREVSFQRDKLCEWDLYCLWSSSSEDKKLRFIRRSRLCCWLGSICEQTLSCQWRYVRDKRHPCCHIVPGLLKCQLA